MRIVAGSARGRPLDGPTFEGLRPSSDRTRQVLFDLLGQRFDGGRVLDLCCGTGALALEALSRGCGQALLIDSDPRALELAGRNAAATGFAELVELRQRELPQALASLPASGVRLLLADPPYDRGPGAPAALEILLRWSGGAGILAPDGVLVIETSRHSPFDPAAALAAGGLAARPPHRVGDTLLHLFDPAPRH